MSKINTDFTTSSWDFLGKEMSKYLKEIQGELIESREEGLTEAAQYLKQQFKDNTPVDTGGLKQSWDMTTKYKGVRYIYNTEQTNSKEGIVPLLNIVEFSTRHGKPFVRKTFDANENQIKEIIIKNLNKEK